MHDFLLWFGIVANTITVVAGLIAIAGVVWAIVGRARLSITPLSAQSSVAPSLTIAVSSVGSNAIRAVELIAGTLDDNGFSMQGGGIASHATLHRGETVTVIAHEPDEYVFGSESHDGEHRLTLEPGDGFFLTVQWQSSLFPWRTSSRTFAWPPYKRFACDQPDKLNGRAEIRFLKRTREASLNPGLPGFVAPASSRPRAIQADDETFDKLSVQHSGPVLVGFGPTWQGKWWNDVQRMLHAIAGKHASRVKVLFVNVDECPRLAARFETDEVPVFKILVGGQVVSSYTGPHGLPDLEREFSEFLQ
jgi:hypothetical protein